MHVSGAGCTHQPCWQLSPWLTRHSENTSLPTNTSFLTKSHRQLCALCTCKYSFRQVDALNAHAFALGDWTENLPYAAETPLWQHNCIMSYVDSHLVNHSGQEMSLLSGYCLNHAAPKSYFHCNRSIPQRGHEVRSTLIPGFVARTDDTPWAWPGCQGWCDTSIPDRQPFWWQTFFVINCSREESGTRWGVR